jgi:hypothetical protein
MTLSSKVALGAVGIIGIGLCVWQNWDKFVSAGAYAVAKMAPTLYSPEQAADQTIKSVIKYILEPDETFADHALQVAKGYASMLIPCGSLITTAVGRTLIQMWNGISPAQDFAYQVFTNLDPAYRNQYLARLAMGIPQLAAAFAVQRVNQIGAAVDFVNGQRGLSQWN